MRGIVHSSPIFFGEQEDMAPDPKKARAAFTELMRRQLKSGRPKDWFRAWFTEGVVDLVSDRRRTIKCPALSRFFYMDPTGMVFVCHILDEPVGMLHEGYDNLVKNNPDKLELVAECDDHCWMTCTVAPIMRSRIPSVLGWIVKNKIAPPPAGHFD